jgi:hypothetical protein
VTFPSHTTILVDLAQLIVDAVPVLSNHVVIGPMVEAPLELCLQVEYGEINIDWDGMEVADHALVVRIGYPWQEGSGFAEAYARRTRRSRVGSCWVLTQRVASLCRHRFALPLRPWVAHRCRGLLTYFGRH